MIFIMRGATNSGKDYFAYRHFKDHCILSSDKIRLQLLDDDTDQSKNALVFDELRHRLELRLRFGCTYTVINATNLKYKDAEQYINIADSFNVPTVIISIEPASSDILINRNNKRGEAGGLKVPEEVIHRHLNTYYAGMPRFVEEAKVGRFKWIRINQDWEVVDEI